ATRRRSMAECAVPPALGARVVRSFVSSAARPHGTLLDTSPSHLGTVLSVDSARRRVGALGDSPPTVFPAACRLCPRFVGLAILRSQGRTPTVRRTAHRDGPRPGASVRSCPRGGRRLAATRCGAGTAAPPAAARGGRAGG